MSNRIYGAFDSVHAEGELKEHTKKYLAQNSTRRHFSPVRYAIAGIRSRHYTGRSQQDAHVSDTAQDGRK